MRYLVIALSIVGIVPALAAPIDWAGNPPNILWLSTEDIGPHLGCYDDPDAITPTLDQLAAHGIRYSNAFTVAPVCAVNRTGIITGMYPTTLGMHNMREGGEGVAGSIKPLLPDAIIPFPKLLQKAGYYCTNNSKEDYNFRNKDGIWNESSKTAHWKKRPEDTPFFSVFNYTRTHEGSGRHVSKNRDFVQASLDPKHRRDPDKVQIPPYHPDTPVVRKTWAHYHELITVMDGWVADHLQALKDEGIADNTIVFFWSDHGTGLPRNKRWALDSGLHVPLIVHVPEKLREKLGIESGVVEDQLINSIDLGPTVLNLLGVEVPEIMQGQAFLGPDQKPEREYIFAARNRMDERYDPNYVVRDKQYLYVRHYMPWKPFYQYTNTAEKGTILQEFRRLEKAGELKGDTAWFIAKEKPAEVLFDTHTDPHNIKNLARDEDYKDVIDELSTAHRKWQKDSGDMGLLPEHELVMLEKEFGSRYDGMEARSSTYSYRVSLWAAVASFKNEELENKLIEQAQGEDSILRYWAMTGPGLLGDPQHGDILRQGLTDVAPTVRVAAAEALCRLGIHRDAAMKVLMTEAASEHQWIRLAAVTVLDELGEEARPAMAVLCEALKDQDNKYVVRVANHALNVLEGTERVVR